MVGTGNAAALLGRYGARTTIAAAALVFGAGHALLLLAVAEIGVGGSVLWLVPGLVVGGVGMGVALSGLVGVVMGSVEPRHAGTVSGTSSTVQQLATRWAWPWSGSSSSAGSTTGWSTPSRPAWSTWSPPRWPSRSRRRSCPAGRAAGRLSR